MSRPCLKDLSTKLRSDRPQTSASCSEGSSQTVREALERGNLDICRRRTALTEGEETLLFHAAHLSQVSLQPLLVRVCQDQDPSSSRQINSQLHLGADPDVGLQGDKGGELPHPVVAWRALYGAREERDQHHCLPRCLERRGHYIGNLGECVLVHIGVERNTGLGISASELLGKRHPATHPAVRATVHLHQAWSVACHHNLSVRWPVRKT
mmetsp:Transcript_94072/g.265676  ORF Transcript_94072/g.265676 Transcript_94072/m.265676 type:complete len:210 (+) Transcript_94072:138-767(+)